MLIDEIPKPDVFWARPPAQAQGDMDADDIFKAVGMALTRWEMVETQALQFFMLFAQSYSPAAARAYGSIVSAGGRRDAIDSAAKTCFAMHKVEADDAARFKLFMDHWGRASGRRNEIAHGVVTSVTIQSVERGYFLRPADYSTTKNRTPPGYGMPTPEQIAADEFWFLPGVYRYTREDISRFTEQFSELNRAGGDIYLHLIKAYPRMWELSLPPKAAAR